MYNRPKLSDSNIVLLEYFKNCCNQSYYGHASNFVFEKDSDKVPATYDRIFARYAEAAHKAVMIGNSLKSDVVPALSAGGAGIFVPHEIAWELEHDDEPVSHARYRRVAHLGEVEQAIGELSKTHHK